MKYKLVALDLDGTLLDENRRLSAKNKETIRLVREQGTEVTICTGRMYRSALPYARELELELPLITYNGGLVMWPDGKKVLYQRSLKVSQAREIILAARQKGFSINYYYEDRLLVEKIDEQNRLYARWSGVPLELVDDLASLPYEPIKLLLMGRPEQLDEFSKEWGAKFGDTIYITKSWTSFLEFMNPEATKGRGLNALADYLGIEQEGIMCLGDSYNDLEMFKSAGLAVAMGNANQTVKEAADYVTGTNEQNGVALALEKFILQQDKNARVR